MDEGDAQRFADSFGERKRAEDESDAEAREDATIMTKLENIQNTMIEVKSEMGSYRNEMKEIREYYIRASESLKSLHKRVNKVEDMLNGTHQHQEE